MFIIISCPDVFLCPWKICSRFIFITDYVRFLLFLQGCISELKNFVDDHLLILGIVAVSIAGIQVCNEFYLKLSEVVVNKCNIKFVGTHLYTRVERGMVRGKCLVQEHNSVSPARAGIQTARSGVDRTNHEATAPPLVRDQ